MPDVPVVPPPNPPAPTPAFNWRNALVTVAVGLILAIQAWLKANPTPLPPNPPFVVDPPIPTPVNPPQPVVKYDYVVKQDGKTLPIEKGQPIVDVAKLGPAAYDVQGVSDYQPDKFTRVLVIDAVPQPTPVPTPNPPAPTPSPAPPAPDPLDDIGQKSFLTAPKSPAVLLNVVAAYDTVIFSAEQGKPGFTTIAEVQAQLQTLRQAAVGDPARWDRWGQAMKAEWEAFWNRASGPPSLADVIQFHKSVRAGLQAASKITTMQTVPMSRTRSAVDHAKFAAMVREQDATLERDAAIRESKATWELK